MTEGSAGKLRKLCKNITQKMPLKLIVLLSKLVGGIFRIITITFLGEIFITGTDNFIKDFLYTQVHRPL